MAYRRSSSPTTSARSRRPRRGTTPTLHVVAATVAALATLSRPARADEQLVEQRESRYNSIFVHRSDGYVTMTFGHNKRLFTESVYNPRDELDLPVTYTRYMTVALAYSPPANRILEVGFGGGRTAWYLHKSLPACSVTSVELDPDVIALAKKWFGIRDDKGFAVAAKDGRAYLMEHDARYDAILLDAYRGPFVPFHLMTAEFYRLVQRRLAEGGVVVQNVEPTTMLFDAALATVGSVFAHVDVYPAEGNAVMVAYDGPPRSQASLESRARAVQEKVALRYDLAAMLRDRRVVSKIPPGRVLTDDFAPVEALKAIERHNRKWDDVAQPPR